MNNRRKRQSLPRININYNQDSSVPELLYLVYRYKKNNEGKHITLKYSTRIKVPARLWDNKSQTVKHGVNLPLPIVSEYNLKLFKLKKHCIEIVSDNNNISVNDFKELLDKYLGIRKFEVDNENDSFIKYFRNFINKSSNHERTILKYNSTLQQFDEFQIYKGVIIAFNSLNVEFVHEFAKWIYQQKGSSQNTVSKHIQIIKLVLRDAFVNNHHNNSSFQYPEFAVKRIKTTKHFLELNQLEKLTNHDFSKSPNLDIARDLWVLSANTGLRYSDFSILQKEHIVNIDGLEVLKVNTYKGNTTKDDTEVLIPILPAVMHIIEKYNYNFPKAYSSQKMNLYIKEACKQAGINRQVESRRSIAGKMILERKPIHEYITNHSGRYTYINIMLNDYEIPPHKLGKITGQSVKVLMGYERKSKVENVKEVFHTIQRKNFTILKQVK